MITVTEAAPEGDLWLVRYSGTPDNQWHMYKTPIDAMLEYVAMVSAVKYKPSVIADMIGIDSDALSRVRRRKQPINDAWLLWAHEYSGAPIASLRVITNTRRP